MNHLNTYAGFLRRFIKPQKKLKIVFDSSNGTTAPILKRLFTHHSSLTTHYLNNIPNGNFPGHGPDPLKQGALSQLQKEVKKRKADLGIIFDADGDRVFFIDNLGRFINQDVVAYLLIWHLKPKKVIIDVRTGWLIRKSKLPITNYQLLISRVGHYFIKKIIHKTKTDFGAEYSGHYYFKEFFGVDAGIFTAIHVINAVSKLPYKISDFIDLLPQYYRSPEMNFEVKNKEKLMEKIEKIYGKKGKKQKIDGLTVEFDDRLAGRSQDGGWWFNVRPSNTELLIRLIIEATSQKLLDKKTKELKKIISSSKY